TLVALDTEYQGRGLGTLMIKKVVDDCADNGYKKIRLEVDNSNIKAVKLYEKLGFRKEKETSDNTAFYCLTL
ncbi:MAG: GNAT family N-acetyltransferase, partial [Ruminococcus sp.]|nr:GNAT family N-acetyltransferase [Ruminococcus sp.]